MKISTVLLAAGAAVTLALLAGCTAPPPRQTPAAGETAANAPLAIASASAPAQAASAAAAPPPVMAFEDAVDFAANNLFGKAVLPAGAGRLPVVVDPLIDGNSGMQSVATRSMEQRIGKLLKGSYPRYDLQPFSTATLARAPLLFIGTVTAVDGKGGNAPGPRDWYRICLALVDLHTGTIVGKGLARANVKGVDATPTAFFQDSPAWVPDGATEGYVKTCQGTKAGDPINPAYWDRIVAAALINDAMNSYDAGRFDEALDLYRGVARSPGGDQLRVYNGLYLSSLRLGRKEEASQAFGRIVEFGLGQKRLGVKFLFRPGSTLFLNDPQFSAQYPQWLRQIGQRTAQRETCLEVAGHTSRTGPEPLNDRLSLMRAQFITQGLESAKPGVAKRTTAVGKGSREPITGLGTDDARDAVDRRVEFKVVDCRPS